MKRINRILGASLAGFTALTMAAITTTTTDVIAFKASTRQLRVTASTHMISVSHVQRIPVNRISVAESSFPSRTVPALTQQRTQPTIRVHQSTIAPVFIPTTHNTAAEHVGSRTNYGKVQSDTDFSFAEIPNEQWNTLKDVFAGRMGEELRTPFPGLDPKKIPGYDGPDKSREGYVPDPDDPWLSYDDVNNLHDISWRSCRWDQATWGKVMNWGSGRDNPLYTEGTSLWRVDDCNDTNKGGGKDGGKSTGESNTNDDSTDVKPTETTDDKPKDTEANGEVAEKEKDNSNGGEGDDGNDPDEMRNALRDENLNVRGLESEAAMGGYSGSDQEGAPGTTPQRPDGSEWERHRQKISGRGAADPDDIVGPDEMANPVGRVAAGINIVNGQAMSPTVDDQQNGNGPSGPIGPVATQTRAEASSVEMNSHLTSAMSDPMGSPTIDDSESGNGPGGPIGPVANQ